MSYRWIRPGLLVAALVGAAGCVVAPEHPHRVWAPGYWALAPIGHVWVGGRWVVR